MRRALLLLALVGCPKGDDGDDDVDTDPVDDTDRVDTDDSDTDTDDSDTDTDDSDTDTDDSDTDALPDTADSDTDVLPDTGDTDTEETSGTAATGSTAEASESASTTETSESGATAETASTGETEATAETASTAPPGPTAFACPDTADCLPTGFGLDPTGHTGDSPDTDPPLPPGGIFDTLDTSVPTPVAGFTACTSLPTALTDADARLRRLYTTRENGFGRAATLFDADGDGRLDIVAGAEDVLTLTLGPVPVGVDTSAGVDARITHTRSRENWPHFVPMFSADLDGDGREALYVPGRTYDALPASDFIVQVARASWNRGQTTLLGRWDAGPVDTGGDGLRPLGPWRDADGPGHDALLLGMPFDGNGWFRRRPTGGVAVAHDHPPAGGAVRPDPSWVDPSKRILGKKMVPLGDPDGVGGPEVAISRARRIEVVDITTVEGGVPGGELATVSIGVGVTLVDLAVGGGGDVTGDGIPDLAILASAQDRACGGGSSHTGWSTGTAHTGPHSGGTFDSFWWLGDSGLGADTADDTAAPCVPASQVGPDRWSILVFAGPIRGDLTELDADAVLPLGVQPRHGLMSPAAPGDLDGDGLGDLVIGAWDGSDYRIDILPGPLSGTLTLPTDPVVWTAGGRGTPGIGDLTGDFRPDLMIGDPRRYDGRSGSGSVTVWELCPAP